MSRPPISVKLQAAIPYMCHVREEEITVDSKVELEIRSSTLNSTFVEGKNRGWFTRHPIAAGTVIAMVDMNQECVMNDGRVDLGPILNAGSSVEMYTGWKKMYESYYDPAAADRINVRMISNRDGPTFYQAFKDIPADGELLRMYGFTTWIFELITIINSHTVAGFAKFISELVNSDELAGDPYEHKVQRLDRILRNHIPNIDFLNLERFDASMTSTAPTPIGDVICAEYQGN